MGRFWTGADSTPLDRKSRENQLKNMVCQIWHWSVHKKKNLPIASPAWVRGPEHSGILGKGKRYTPERWKINNNSNHNNKHNNAGHNLRTWIMALRLTRECCCCFGHKSVAGACNHCTDSPTWNRWTVVSLKKCKQIRPPSSLVTYCVDRIGACPARGDVCLLCPLSPRGDAYIWLSANEVCMAAIVPKKASASDRGGDTKIYVSLLKIVRVANRPSGLARLSMIVLVLNGPRSCKNCLKRSRMPRLQRHKEIPPQKKLLCNKLSAPVVTNPTAS